LTLLLGHLAQHVEGGRGLEPVHGEQDADGLVDTTRHRTAVNGIDPNERRVRTFRSAGISSSTGPTSHQLPEPRMRV
jgi:hypothetical protein